MHNRMVNIELALYTLQLDSRCKLVRLMYSSSTGSVPKAFSALQRMKVRLSMAIAILPTTVAVRIQLQVNNTSDLAYRCKATP